MRIVNIMQGTNLGGTELSSLRLMEALKERGHSLEVISLTPIGRLGPLLEKNEIPAIGLNYLGLWGWRSFPALRRTLRSVKADALMMTGHNYLAMLALGSLCRGKRLLHIHFYHTGLMPPWQWRLIYRTACRRFRAVIFCSDFIRHEAEDLYPRLKPLAHTLYNPRPIPQARTDQDKRSARLAMGLPLDSPIVGNAGRLVPGKRYDVFLRTARQILDQMPQAIFLIAGDGPERAQLEQLAKKLKVSDQIKWLGWREDLTSFYQSIDVLLFNSDWEAMGMTPLEAISHGIPIVASCLHGGLKEVIGSDSGMLISTHDVPVLAEKVIDFLQNPQRARKTGMEARKRSASSSTLTFKPNTSSHCCARSLASYSHQLASSENVSDL